jgi:redox-sensitive bicupin YhaK (pirin superfamily)
MNEEIRKVARVIQPQAVVEGAGVRLRRSIATRALDYLDPFLLLDHFASKEPADYAAGFPLHPHRGIETVTYLLTGAVRHKDTLGNSGEIGAGDVQWMSAGRGILHEEMPQVRPEGIAGFQLWVNLPARLKMTAPRYQEINAAEIPEAARDGSRMRVIAGEVDGVRGPVTGIAVNPNYLDVTVSAQSSFVQPLPSGQSAFSYVFEGAGRFGGRDQEVIAATRLVVWGDGDTVEVHTEKSPVRFLLVSGRPLHEPVARYGPFVMNTREEIEQTLRQLQQGTFATESAFESPIV